MPVWNVCGVWPKPVLKLGKQVRKNSRSAQNVPPLFFASGQCCLKDAGPVCFFSSTSKVETREIHAADVWMRKEPSINILSPKDRNRNPWEAVLGTRVPAQSPTLRTEEALQTPNSKLQTQNSKPRSLFSGPSGSERERATERGDDDRDHDHHDDDEEKEEE